MSKKKKKSGPEPKPHCGYTPVWKEEYDNDSFYKRIWLECPICGLHTSRFGDKYKITVLNNWNAGLVYENKKR